MPTDLVKVKLTEGEFVETLWAYPLGNDLYKLDNTPFYAYGVSWQDIIEARPESVEDFPAFVRVVHKSGYRTVRVIFDPPLDKAGPSREIAEQLLRMGCRYEGATHTYVCIDVPAGIDLSVVCEYLTSTGHHWEHADPTYEQLHPNS